MGPSGASAQGGARGAGGAEPGAAARPAVPCPLPPLGCWRRGPRTRAGRRRRRVPGTGKAQLCAGFRPASPGPSPPPSSRLSAAGRRGGEAQAERARGWLSSDQVWRDPGLRPLAGSAGTAREAGGAVRPRSGSGARRGQRVTRLRPGPGPWDALCSGRASLRIVGRGRRPEYAREAGALRTPHRARSPRPEPPGTFSARRGQGPALPGMRNCARRRRGPRDPSAHAPVSSLRRVIGAGATGRGPVGGPEGLGPAPGT